jgi:Mg-dependent DNase
MLQILDTIAFAKNVNKPLIIHCRNADQEVMTIIKEEKAHQVGGVVHCFCGDINMAKFLADNNFHVSYTGIITFKGAKALREVCKQIPLEQIMLETDAPYLAPEPHRGKECQPKHILEID